MPKIEIFNRTEKYLIVNSIEIGGNKLTIPPASSKRGSGTLDSTVTEDLGIQELISRGDISIKKTKETPAAKSSTRTTTKKTTKKATATKKTTKKATAKKTASKRPTRKTKPKTKEGAPVVMTARGRPKRVPMVSRGEDSFVENSPTGDDEKEYSAAFIEA